MRLLVRPFLREIAGLVLLASTTAAGAQTITLHGAVQFADVHPYNQTLLKFEELTGKYYDKPIKFVLGTGLG